MPALRVFSAGWSYTRNLSRPALPLKQACTIPEIVAILAHELGHWALSHLIKGLVVTMLHLMLFFTLYGEMVSSAAMFRSFGSLFLFQPNRPSVQISSPLAILPSQHSHIYPDRFTEQPTLVGLVIFGMVVAPIEQVPDRPSDRRPRDNMCAAPILSETPSRGNE